MFKLDSLERKVDLSYYDKSGSKKFLRHVRTLILSDEVCKQELAMMQLKMDYDCYINKFISNLPEKLKLKAGYATKKGKIIIIVEDEMQGLRRLYVDDVPFNYQKLKDKTCSFIMPYKIPLIDSPYYIQRPIQKKLELIVR